MDLTIKEIKEKQKTLDKEIRELLHKFYEETEIKVFGDIHFGYTSEKHQHWISLEYKNPFK